MLPCITRHLGVLGRPCLPGPLSRCFRNAHAQNRSICQLFDPFVSSDRDDLLAGRRIRERLRSQREPVAAQLRSICAIGACIEATAAYRTSAAYSALMLAALITLAQFSVYLTTKRPKSALELANGAMPSSARRALILGSSRAVLISLLRVATMSAGVFLGTVMPTQAVFS